MHPSFITLKTLFSHLEAMINQNDQQDHLNQKFIDENKKTKIYTTSNQP